METGASSPQATVQQPSKNCGIEPEIIALRKSVPACKDWIRPLLGARRSFYLVLNANQYANTDCEQSPARTSLPTSHLRSHHSRDQYFSVLRAWEALYYIADHICKDASIFRVVLYGTRIPQCCFAEHKTQILQELPNTSSLLCYKSTSFFAVQLDDEPHSHNHQRYMSKRKRSTYEEFQASGMSPSGHLAPLRATIAK